MICRLTASGGQGGPSKHGRNWQRKTAVSGSSPQLTLKKGAPGDQVWDLLCVQLASYLERGPLMWMMPLHLHVNQKSDYDIWYDESACWNVPFRLCIWLYIVHRFLCLWLKLITSVVRWTDHPNMTITVDCNVKNQTQKQRYSFFYHMMSRLQTC